MGKTALAAMILFCGLGVAQAADPVMQREGDDGMRLGDDRILPDYHLPHFFVGRTEGAADEEELGDLLQHDFPHQKTGLIPGSALAAGGVTNGDCYLTPLLCLFKSATPDLRCVYTCIGSHGRGEISRQQLTTCDILAGCMLFENCLALCISIIPYDLQPVIWW